MVKKTMRKQTKPLLTREERVPCKAVTVDDLISDESLWMDDTTAIDDAATIMQLFLTENWVFITADLLASNFALPWPRVMRSIVVDGRESGMPAQGHPIQRLLEDPTLYTDAQSFWYVAGIYDCMIGNTILWYMPGNEKFMVIPSHEVAIEFNPKDGSPMNYVWTPSGKVGKSTKFKAEDIVHVKRPNPFSKFWGLSPFIPGKVSVLFNRYSGEFLNSFFEKGATPQMIVETEISNNKEAIATLAKSFELVNGGRKNQRRPLVLPKGAKVTQVQMTLADTKLFDFINQNREVILNILRIPKHAVGLQTAGSLGSEEHKTALRFMWASTVNPMLKRYATSLTKFFQKKGLLKPDHYIEFDSSDIEIANEDMNSRADFAIKISKTHTLNEVRRIVWGEGPVEGGDFIPGVLNDPAMQETPKKPPNDGGEQPNPVTLPPPVQPPEAMPTAKLWDRMDEIESSDGLSTYSKAVDDELVRTEESMLDLSTNLLLRQLEGALEVLKKSIPEKSKSIDYDAFEAELEEEFQKDLPYWQENYKNNLGPTVNVGYASQLKLVFNPVHREALEALQENTAASRKAILAGRGIESFKNISRTTTDQIMETIAKSVSEGRTISEISQAIATNFKEITWERARLISRTETLTAMSVGQDSACKNAAKVIPDAVKVWISAKDERTRHSHSNMHAVQVKATEKFRIIGKKGKVTEMNVPRDPKVKGSPEEIIQCRCTVAVVSPEDLDLIKV